MFIFIAFIIFLLLIIYFSFYKKNLIKVKSYLDNKYYYVQNKKDSKKASDILSILNSRIEKLIDFLWLKKDTKYKYMKKYIYRLRKKYNYTIISENDDKNYTSYSLAKKYIYICIRQRDKDGKENEFVDINVLMYVALHELSHFIADETISEDEHNTNSEFKMLFENLLITGEEAGVYIPVNFKNNPAPYCGLTIK